MQLSLVSAVAARAGAILYWGFALTVMASVGWQMATKFGWVGPHARAIAGGTYKSTVMLRGEKLDLEGGEIPDLRWTSAARKGPGPRTVQPERGAAIALAGDLDWEKINRDTLTRLKYARRSLTEGPDGQIRRGTVFAVRTVEGNLAKVRLFEMSGREIRTQWEWVLYEQPTLSR